ncbi:MAG: sulfatase-like hydrolase/transferase, partial [Desulfobacterales bacterium]|nr:sulfatase-like hydrolase/transferase [Desulfobacterales bacterium]
MIIILYVMDSLRPDFLSCYGYPKETSPNIDRLAPEGVLFTNAFAQCTWTRPSGASILSSTYPSAHGVMKLHDTFPQEIP